MKKILILLPFFIFTHNVFSQQVVVGLSKMNTAYLSLDNTLNVMAENVSCDSIILKTSNGSITKKDARCSFNFIPERPGNAIIRVYKLNDKDTIRIANYELRIKRLPLTVYSDSPYILKEQINDLHNKIYVCALNTGLSIRIPLKSYRILLRKDGEIIFDKIYNDNDDQSDLTKELSKLNFGDQILILEPKYVWNDKILDAHGTLTLFIK